MAFVTLTIPASLVDSDLTNFPLVITERDLPQAFFDDGTASNIQVKNEGGSSDLLTEVAWHDAANTRARIHVKVPTISSSVDTKIELHWDVTQASTGTVFTMYECVIPLKVLNFASVTNYGTDVQTITENGTIVYSNNGAEFSGGNGSIRTSLGTGSTSMYMVAHGEQDAAVQKTIMSFHSTAVQRSNLTVDDGDQVALWDNRNSWLDTSPIADPGTNTFYTHAGRIDGANERHVWYNGGNKNTDTTVTAMNSQDTIWIGLAANSAEDWDGIIQEARLTTDVTFSDAWVKYEHYNLENATDYTVAAADAAKRRYVSACEC